jgi:hypothetical protein
LLLVGISFSVGTTPARAQLGVDALIDSVVLAYGDRDRVLDVETYRLEATMEAHQRPEDATVLRIIRGRDQLAVLIHYPTRVELRVVSGDEAWRGSAPDRLTPVSGPLRAAMQLQAARANIPWSLHDWRSEARLVDSADSVLVLEVPLEPTLLLRAVIDAHTYRVVAAETLIRMDGMELSFATQYSDFRAVDGVLFPFHEENYASGVHTASTQVELIEVDPPDARLKLPG